jgi:uncharacterized damage-inducible protein DinB
MAAGIRLGDVADRCLERVPEDRFDWKPHSKCMSLGRLMTFLAMLPSWFRITLAEDSLDLAVGPQDALPTRVSRETALEQFDRNVAAGREALARVSDERMQTPWTLRSAGRELFTRPRHAVLRGAVLNHLIHHRAQLALYLRLLELPVPAIYGPSAEEPEMDRWLGPGGHS